ncbi:hypothetical protein EZV73_22095 [Acidaminobacter sp. JC074]|uniref:hypothetical protein n=1 Tax=Acidaminobacter sp. JC074 TaxID=2530199 RepID=UPI001F0D0D04|nr:hypothetical protein [Acidaminobacter sp. JC074]MCH4890290.1 hypothetical protein [Acidaminobacter sp. JC074]
MKYLKYLTMIFIGQMFLAWMFSYELVNVRYLGPEYQVYTYILLLVEIAIIILIVVFLSWINNRLLDKLIEIDQHKRYKSAQIYDQMKDKSRHEMIRDYQKLKVLMTENKTEELEVFIRKHKE